MSLVWRKIRRSNQTACKYGYMVTFHELMLEATPKWQPDKIVIAWIRRRSGRASRRVQTRPYRWEPTLTDPLRGMVVWPSVDPEFVEIETTLYRDKRTNSFDDKEWLFSVEEVISSSGKTRCLASVPLNLKMFRTEMPDVQTEIKLKLKPMFKHVVSCILQLSLTCRLLHEGEAIDDDLQSVTSALSTKNPMPMDEDRGSLSVEIGESTTTLSGDSGDDRAKKSASDQLTALAREIDSWPSEADWSAAAQGQIPPSSTPPGAGLEPPTPVRTHQHGSSPQPVSPELEQGLPRRRSERSRSRPGGPSPDNSPLVTDKTISNGDLYLDSAQGKTFNEDIVANYSSDALARRPGTQQQPPTSAQTNTRDSPSRHTPRGPPGTEKASPAPETSASSFSRGLHPSASERQIDLMAWCQTVTTGYPHVNVKDFTTSWRNGMAFAAIVHHFRPDLLDYQALHPSDVRGNCKSAFDAASKLGISSLIDPEEMVVTRIPDKIAITAYVHQLRYHFSASKSELRSSQIEDKEKSASPATPVSDDSPAPTAVVSVKTSGKKPKRSRSRAEKEDEIVEEFERLRMQREHEHAIDMSVTPLEVSTNIESSSAAIRAVSTRDRSPRSSVSPIKSIPYPTELTERLPDSTESVSPLTSTADRAYGPSPTMDPPIGVTDSIKKQHSSWRKSLPTSPGRSRRAVRISRTPSANSQGSRSVSVGSGRVSVGSGRVSVPASPNQGGRRSGLMTREELMDPFDVGADKSSQLSLTTETPSSQDQTGFSTDNITTDSSGFGSDMKRPTDLAQPNDSGDIKVRARNLLEQFMRQHSNEQQSPSDEQQQQIDDEKRARLKERAKQLIEEARLQAHTGRAIKISETFPPSAANPLTAQHPQTPTQRLVSGLRGFAQSAPNSRGQTPDRLAPELPIYQFKNRLGIIQPEQSDTTNMGLDPEGEPGPMGHFDRFKRFGSMKAVELTQITSNLAQSIRSYSVPREMSAAAGGNVSTSIPDLTVTAPTVPSHPLAPAQGIPSAQGSSPSNPRKVDDSIVTFDTDGDGTEPRRTESVNVDSIESINAELDKLARSMRQLDEEASNVEKRWRQIMKTTEVDNEASEKEQQLANQYLTLLNQRNQLTRREYHLQLLHRSKELEQQFATVHNELGELLQVEERDKTETVKEKIDSLMSQLLSLVQERDTNAKQIMNSEAGTEEDEDTGLEALSRIPHFNDPHDANCTIQ